MNENQQRIEYLQEQILKKASVEIKLDDRMRERKSRYASVQEAQATLRKVRFDLEKLDQISLLNLLRTITGKKGELQTQNRNIIQRAEERYEAANQAYQANEKELAALQNQYAQIQQSQLELNHLISYWANELKNCSSPTSEHLLALEDKLFSYQAQKKELDEAISAGNRALSTCDSIFTELNKAEGWGKYDILVGGTFSSLAKHDHLDTAQTYITLLQKQLKDFRTELLDISIDANIQVSFDTFTKTMDWFFDNIFTDLSVQKQIQASQNEIYQIQNSINSTMNRLSILSTETESQITSLEARRRELVLAWACEEPCKEQMV